MNSNFEPFIIDFYGYKVNGYWNTTKKEAYYYVIDLIAALAECDIKQAKIYWERLKPIPDERVEKILKERNTLRKKISKIVGKNEVIGIQGMFTLTEFFPSPNCIPLRLKLLDELGKKFLYDEED